MNGQTYTSRLALLKSRLTAWMAIAFLLGIGQVMTIFLFINMRSPEKTIIVPAEIRQSFWVQGNDVSPEYYSEMAEYFVGKLLTYNDANAAGQFQDVQKYMNPVVQADLGVKLQAEAQQIKTRQLASAFFQEDMKVKGKRVLGYGKVMSFMAGQLISTRQMGYELIFDYRGGRLYVDSFKKLDMPAGGISAYEAQSAQAGPIAPPAQEAPKS